MAAQYIGTEDSIIESYSHTDTLTGCEMLDGVKQTIVYVDTADTLADIRDTAPALASALTGTSAPSDTTLYLYSRTFASTGEADTWRVTLTYGELDAESSASTDSTDSVNTYTLASESATKSILLHPRYAATDGTGITDNERAILKTLLEGKAAYDYLVKNSNGIYVAAKKTTSGAKTISELSASFGELALEAYGLILAGNTSFEEYTYTWTEQTTTSSLTVPDSLGLISSPDGTNVPGGYSWILSSVSAQKTGSEKWTITKRWKSAPTGAEWDSIIYGSRSSSSDSSDT